MDDSIVRNNSMVEVGAAADRLESALADTNLEALEIQRLDQALADLGVGGSEDINDGDEGVVFDNDDDDDFGDYEDDDFGCGDGGGGCEDKEEDGAVENISTTATVLPPSLPPSTTPSVSYTGVQFPPGSVVPDAVAAATIAPPPPPPLLSPPSPCVVVPSVATSSCNPEAAVVLASLPLPPATPAPATTTPRCFVSHETLNKELLAVRAELAELRERAAQQQQEQEAAFSAKLAELSAMQNRYFAAMALM